MSDLVARHGPWAVHCLTQRSADFFGLTDRGVVEPGRRASDR